MKHAIMRNFGGLQSNRVNALEEFENRLEEFPKEQTSITDCDEEVGSMVLVNVKKQNRLAREQERHYSLWLAIVLTTESSV